MIIGGDLGGTKTLLALADGSRNIIRQQRYASVEYPDFAALLDEFLAGVAPIDSACFAIAGPTDGLNGQLTYLPWNLSAANLGRRHAIRQVTLVNDFAAAAHGLPLLVPEAIVTLQTGKPALDAPRLVIGAGTGLGVAGLLADAGRYRVVPGEGGHIGFAPQTPEQGELWQWLHKQRGRVTTEDIVSGPGLARIYHFLGGAIVDPATIGRAAVDRSDERSMAAVSLWLACFGAFAGDLALHWMASGGIYLAGGIAGKLLPHVDVKPFIRAFQDKREHAAIAKEMPIRLVSSEELGLLGALAIADARRDNAPR